MKNSILKYPHQQIFVNHTPVHKTWVTEIEVWQIGPNGPKIVTGISFDRDDYSQLKNALQNTRTTKQ